MAQGIWDRNVGGVRGGEGLPALLPLQRGVGKKEHRLTEERGRLVAKAALFGRGASASRDQKMAHAEEHSLEVIRLSKR